MRNFATKTGVILTDKEIENYHNIKRVWDSGFLVAFPIGKGNKNYAAMSRTRELFRISCNKLQSLGLIRVVHDYAWGYAPTDLDICEVLDEAQDLGEYWYR